MLLMPSIEGRVTPTPGFSEDSIPPGSRYRWTLNIPLPFFFPVKNGVHRNPEFLGDPYDLWIYNDHDRFFVGRKSQPGIPQVFLAPKGAQVPIPKDCWQY